MFFRKVYPILSTVVRLIIFCYVLFGTAYGQTSTRVYAKVDVIITKLKKKKEVTVNAEILTAFPGGDSAWIRSLENSFDKLTLHRNKALNGVYVVSIQFIVDKEGIISDVKALTNHGYGMEEEAMRCIKKSGAWTPAPQGGREVKPYRR